MKLNEYIYEKLMSQGYGGAHEHHIEKWIVDWYRDEFNEVGCDGDVPKPRMPPTWLADWRVLDEAT